MEEEAGMLGLHGRASYAKIGMLREAEDGGGEVAGGGCGRQARGGEEGGEVGEEVGCGD